MPGSGGVLRAPAGRRLPHILSVLVSRACRRGGGLCGFAAVMVHHSFSCQRAAFTRFHRAGCVPASFFRQRAGVFAALPPLFAPPSPAPKSRPAGGSVFCAVSPRGMRPPFFFHQRAGRFCGVAAAMCSPLFRPVPEGLWGRSLLRKGRFAPHQREGLRRLPQKCAPVFSRQRAGFARRCRAEIEPPFSF